jgi:predicted RNA binding protein YcfA (HicA-like mRNA interferase family)
MSEKVKEVVKRLTKDGWIYIGTTGSHRHFRHPVKPGRVTVPGKPSMDLAEGTWKSILKQAGLNK